MPTATPAFTSFARRSSLALSRSSLPLLITDSCTLVRCLWPEQALWKPDEGAGRHTEAASGNSGGGGRPAGSRRAVGVGGNGENARPYRARASTAPERGRAGVHSLSDLHEGSGRRNGEPHRGSIGEMGSSEGYRARLGPACAWRVQLSA